MRVPDALQGRDDLRLIVRYTCPGMPTLEQIQPMSALAALKPSPQGLRLLGEAAIGKKEWRKALDWLAEAYAREPANHDIRWSYGRALTKCPKAFKQPDLQITVVKSFFADGESFSERTDVLDSLAAAYESKQDWKQAQEWNDRILAIEPGHGGAKGRDKRLRKALAAATVTTP